MVFGQTNFVCFYLLFLWFVQFNMYHMNLLIFGFSNKPQWVKMNVIETEKAHTHTAANLHKSTLRREEKEYQRSQLNWMRRMKQRKNKIKNEPMPRQWECKRFFAAFVSYQCIPSKVCCCCCCCLLFEEKRNDPMRTLHTHTHRGDPLWICDYGPSREFCH